jgi:uncharacterized oligopeptide transporter (OPT) family protein
VKQETTKSGLTIRAILVASLLSLLLLGSSMYVALKIGALPWPIVFSVIVSGSIIKLLSGGRQINIHEINVAQAGGSIGGLVAAGIAFTLPGILYLNKTQSSNIPWPESWLLGLLIAGAAVLGVLLSVPLKQLFVDQEHLPYPAGTAGAELLKAGSVGGRQLSLIMLVGGAAGLFAVFREQFFPAGFALESLAGYGFFIAILPLPLAVGGGFILGGRAGFSWFAGACIGWLLLIPILINTGWEAAAAKSFTQSLGMGMVLGAGMGFVLMYMLPRVREIVLPIFRSLKSYQRLYYFSSFLGVVALFALNVPPAAAVWAVLGVWLMVAVAARMTGETNIDPLEQFGIFVALLIAMGYRFADVPISFQALFLIVAFVSVACAIAGDAGHDFKSAWIIGTRFTDIVKIDLITAAICGFAAPFVLNVIKAGYADALFTPEMPAPQAQLVASSIAGFQFPLAFWGGFALAFVLEALNRFLPPLLRGKVLIMPLGIGMFLGMGFALPVALGAILRGWIDGYHPHWYAVGLLAAASVMGGEGVTGFAIAVLNALALQSLIFPLLVSFILLAMLWAFIQYRRHTE